MDERHRRRLQDERTCYEELPILERRAICFMLDIAKGDLASVQTWSNIFDFSLVSAAAGILSMMDERKKRVVNAAKYADNELYKYVIDVSRFLLANGLMQSFEAFEFVLVRLFGGELRPFVASIYVATLLHPNGADPERSFEQDMLKAVDHFRSGWGTYAPVFFPVWDFGPPLPLKSDEPDTIVIRPARRNPT